MTVVFPHFRISDKSRRPGRYGPARRRRSCLMLFKYSILLVLLLLAGGVPDVHAADAPFDGPANWGGTGLMETPTARVLEEGRFRVGVSSIDPYRYYYGAVSPLKGLEIGGRVTEILGLDISSAPGWGGYGNYKDKAVDLKYQMLPEGKWTPALAVGLMDPHGTRLYPSQYIVLSKQIYPFDFTLGLGNGRFGKKPLPSQGEGVKLEIMEDPNRWLSDSQFFGGVEFAPSEKFSVMLEYSPIRYSEQTQDPAQKKYFRQAVPSQFNVGLRLRPYRWTDIDLSWQRGNQWGINLSVAFDLGNPLVPIFDPAYREAPEQRLKPMEERIARALYESGFMDVGVLQSGDDLLVEAENDKYFYQPRAVGVALRVLNDIAPPAISVMGEISEALALRVGGPEGVDEPPDENAHVMVYDLQISDVRQARHIDGPGCRQGLNIRIGLHIHDLLQLDSNIIGVPVSFRFVGVHAEVKDRPPRCLHPFLPRKHRDAPFLETPRHVRL